MNYFVRGLGYGAMAFGWLCSFGGGVIIFVSFCVCVGDWLDALAAKRREANGKGNESD